MPSESSTTRAADAGTRSTRVRRPVPASDRWAEEIVQALATLTPAERTVLQLTYREDMTTREIAIRCGLPLAQVRSTLAVALQRLAVALELGPDHG